jgi:hypothetical protein
MTGFVTPAQARETLPCPLAKTFAVKHGPNCDVDKCPVWRWEPLMADAAMARAIKLESRRLAEVDEKNRPIASFMKAATANVRADRKSHNLPTKPTRGWCGLGGKPEA